MRQTPQAATMTEAQWQALLQREREHLAVLESRPARTQAWGADKGYDVWLCLQRLEHHAPRQTPYRVSRLWHDSCGCYGLITVG